MACAFCSSPGASRCTTASRRICEGCKRIVRRIKKRQDRARTAGRDTTLPGDTWRERVDREIRVDRLRDAAIRIGIANTYDTTRNRSQWPDEPTIRVASLWDALR